MAGRQCKIYDVTDYEYGGKVNVSSAYIRKKLAKQANSVRSALLWHS